MRVLRRIARLNRIRRALQPDTHLFFEFCVVRQLGKNQGSAPDRESGSQIVTDKTGTAAALFSVRESVRRNAPDDRVASDAPAIAADKSFFTIPAEEPCG